MNRVITSAHRNFPGGCSRNAVNLKRMRVFTADPPKKSTQNESIAPTSFSVRERNATLISRDKLLRRVMYICVHRARETFSINSESLNTRPHRHTKYKSSAHWYCISVRALSSRVNARWKLLLQHEHSYFSVCGIFSFAVFPASARSLVAGWRASASVFRKRNADCDVSLTANYPRKCVPLRYATKNTRKLKNRGQRPKGGNNHPRHVLHFSHLDRLISPTRCIPAMYRIA